MRKVLNCYPVPLWLAQNFVQLFVDKIMMKGQLILTPECLSAARKNVMQAQGGRAGSHSIQASAKSAAIV